MLAPELIKISGLGVDTPPIFAFSSVHLAQHSWNAASTLHLERDQYAIPRVNMHYVERCVREEKSRVVGGDGGSKVVLERDAIC